MEGGQPSRRGARDSTFLQAEISRSDGVGQPSTLRIRNLSAGGMMADCDALVARGDAVVIEMRGLGRLPATVAWARDGRVGIAFDVPIDPVAARKGASRPPPLGFQIVPPLSGRARRPGIRS